MTEPTGERELWGIHPDAVYDEVTLDLGDGSASYHCWTLNDERVLLVSALGRSGFFAATPILQMLIDGKWETIPDEEEPDDAPPGPVNRL